MVFSSSVDSIRMSEDKISAHIAPGTSSLEVTLPMLHLTHLHNTHFPSIRIHSRLAALLLEMKGIGVIHIIRQLNCPPAIHCVALDFTLVKHGVLPNVLFLEVNLRASALTCRPSVTSCGQQKISHTSNGPLQTLKKLVSSH